MWVTDNQLGEGSFYLLRGLYKYDAYPSQTLLESPDTPFSSFSREFTIAVNDAANEVYVTQANGRSVFLFKNGVYSREWKSLNGTSNFLGIGIAVDNSTQASRGRIYISLTEPEEWVEAVDTEQRPISLPAAEPYIDGNRITGTPSGSFVEVGGVEVDTEGNIYISDRGANAVYEYDSSGTYLRAFPQAGTVAVDPTNGNVLIGAKEYDAFGNFLQVLAESPEGNFFQGHPAFNSHGYLYMPVYFPAKEGDGAVEIYKPTAVVPSVSYGLVSGATTSSGTLNATVDPNGGGGVTSCKFEYGPTTAYGSSVNCAPATSFATQTDVHAEIASLTVETAYHYRVVVTNAKGTKYGEDRTYTPHHVLGLSTDPATNLAENGATLNGSLLGDGTPTYYYFEWGPTAQYGHTTQAPPGASIGSPQGPGVTHLSVDLGSLQPYSTYHYRIVATSAGGTSHGDDQYLTTSLGVPSISHESASDVHADRAVLHGQVNPNGGVTSYRFEYVDDANYQADGYAHAIKAGADTDIGQNAVSQTVTPKLLSGLQPGTVYHYRLVATNGAGTGTSGVDRFFRTFPFVASIDDPCPNSHVRQQTGSALLLDCRAYELVSAPEAGGYDVESDLAPDQMPYGGYPDAENPSRVLYGIHSGALPGPWNPTNRGVDPYVATRTDKGWNTEYVGLPAKDADAAAPFSSTVAEADSGLGSLAFGGPNICAPCFGDGSRGIPVHLPDGSLVQGMVGSIPHPSAEPAGHIGKYFSADGTHLVFGSTAQLEPDGNTNGDVTIYDRNLTTGVTHVVSKTPAGATMTGSGIGELDVSSDGTRILIGQVVAEGNGIKYWHLYMNVGDSGHSIDLTPGATHGVLYHGMTSDGSRVFFTTVDPLEAGETDTSVDLYRADVSPGAATVTRISKGTGGSGDTNACDPAANTKHVRWNSVGSTANCDVLAVGGDGGVASGDGTVYFLSPELLDGLGEGVQNAPNLYVSRPGEAPRFVSTLESSLSGELQVPTGHSPRRNFGFFSGGQYVAVDNSGGPSDGDVYVADTQTGVVLKYDHSGQLMTDWGEGGRISKSPAEAIDDISGIAVSASGTLLVAREAKKVTVEGRVDHVPDSKMFEFEQDGTFLKSFGLYQSNAANQHAGIAIDNAGTLYTYGGNFGYLHILVSEPDGTPTTFLNRRFMFVGFAVDPVNGYMYLDRPAGGVSQYRRNAAGEVIEPDGSTCTGIPDGCRPTQTFDRDLHHITAFAVDPTNHDVYVDVGDEILQFDSTGQRVGAPIGVGVLVASNGLTVNSAHEIFAVNNQGTKVTRFGPPETLSDPETDNPLVIDSLEAPETRETADFQISRNGQHGVFTSSLPLTGYDSADHREIFSFDASTGDLRCSSCNPTGQQATADASLPANGLAVSDDGRVFFDSGEGLVDRDLNNGSDAYEWEPSGINSCKAAAGCAELISTGASPFSSSLLGISADATDAYFFTRDTLAAQDHNGHA